MQPARLLVVDDDRQLAAFLARVAEEAGYEVRIATRIEEVGVEGAEEPSLVFVDLHIGSSDGLAVLRELAAHGCRASVRILSGADPRLLRSATRLAEELGLRVGEPMAKPVPLESLVSVLTAARDAEQAGGAAVRPASASAALTVEELRGALGRGELFVVFQPIVDLVTLEPVGVEALARWRHPVHGVVPPLRFIPLAERAGLASEVSEEVLRHALGFVRRQGSGPDARPLSISVNVGAAGLADRSLPERIALLLAENGLAPERLVVEVTESMVHGSRLDTLEVLNRLRLRGCELSIDDFGTGTSSLERLEQLPCSELKIDRAFVNQIARGGEAEAIVRSTLGLARRLGLRTVAEGIEEPWALGWLRAAGCELGQGYLFSRGLEPTDFAAWLAAWPARRTEIDAAARGGPP
jgi:EAL domain-containing protein (putative c-di-GMP-specific phosphodiesterase class I)/ActR/RegA family two-component response regulator